MQQVPIATIAEVGGNFHDVRIDYELDGTSSLLLEFERDELVPPYGSRSPNPSLELVRALLEQLRAYCRRTGIYPEYSLCRDDWKLRGNVQVYVPRYWLLPGANVVFLVRRLDEDDDELNDAGGNEPLSPDRVHYWEVAVNCTFNDSCRIGVGNYSFERTWLLAPATRRYYVHDVYTQHAYESRSSSYIVVGIRYDGPRRLLTFLSPLDGSITWESELNLPAEGPLYPIAAGKFASVAVGSMLCSRRFESLEQKCRAVVLKHWGDNINELALPATVKDELRAERYLYRPFLLPICTEQIPE